VSIAGESAARGWRAGGIVSEANPELAKERHDDDGSIHTTGTIRRPARR
jgi:hypothetical protein